MIHSSPIRRRRLKSKYKQVLNNFLICWNLIKKFLKIIRKNSKPQSKKIYSYWLIISYRKTWTQKKKKTISRDSLNRLILFLTINIYSFLFLDPSFSYLFITMADTYVFERIFFLMNFFFLL